MIWLEVGFEPAISDLESDVLSTRPNWIHTVNLKKYIQRFESAISDSDSDVLSTRPNWLHTIGLKKIYTMIDLKIDLH